MKKSSDWISSAEELFLKKLSKQTSTVGIVLISDDAQPLPNVVNCSESVIVRPTQSVPVKKQKQIGIVVDSDSIEIGAETGFIA